uniref:Saccharopine dehydrogenase-like oxidoreductase n=1 Tax=Phallusia mammillata TaxID=59560 RepID=A0A6F9DRZ5_9ASCI|nr:saccharopine dehydrogenase-like oxidoreductase [Phallusia mammillata]
MGSEREFDFIIFGASGFTGQYVVQEMLEVNREEGLNWAIAGRSMVKLEKVLSDMRNKGASTQNDPEVQKIIADISDYQSLLLMCKRAKVILDCVGPYRFFGEAVVKACVEAKTSYVDICGEPQFLENMQLKYSDGAKQGGIYIVGACGFDSVPSEMGVVFAEQQFDGILNSVQCYFKTKTGKSGSGLHFGTYESAVYGLSDTNNLIKIRKAFNNQPLPMVGPKAKPKGAVHYQSELQKYAIPFLGADPSVVKRSRRFLYEKDEVPPVQYIMYMCIPGFWNLFLLMFFGGLFKFLAMRSWGRKLLLNHPKFFTAGMCSHEGPTEQQLAETSFSLTMYCEGYSNRKNDECGRTDRPDKKMTVEVWGQEPGYVVTPRIMVQSAIVILKEKDKLPTDGGVYPPGAAFYRTSLIDRLVKRGMKFNVIG